MSMDKLRELIHRRKIEQGSADELISLFLDIESKESKITELQTLIATKQTIQNSTFNPLKAHSKEEVIPEGVEKEFGQRYIFLKRLGIGGMGTVYQVRDQLLQRNLAMKCLHSKLLSNNTILSYFFAEAQVIAQLQHPNIIPIYDFGELPGSGFYYTMLEIQGSNLSEVINIVHKNTANHHWIPDKEKWNFFRLINAFLQICEAIAFAHQRNVVHRDLKPENIMTGAFGEVYVMDWGIAKILSECEDTLKIKKIQIAGTPAYMSPEQAFGDNDRIDTRSDIYSLGAILHEILLRRAPYSGKTPKEIVTKIISGTPPFIQSYEKEGQNSILFEGDHPGAIPKELLHACKKSPVQGSREQISGCI